MREEEPLRKTVTRRAFCHRGLLWGLGMGVASSLGIWQSFEYLKGKEALWPMEAKDLYEARYYQKLAHNLVGCQLCPRRCIIPEGGRSFCRVKENRGGKLYTVIYGLPCSVGKAPIELMPLYHVLPGSPRLTLATASCNLRCKFCHNWHISQVPPEQTENKDLSPQEIIYKALEWEVKSVSFTYTEPTVFYDYMYDIAKLARREGLMALLNSNAFINPEPLRDLLRYIDAVNFDLKGFTQAFYCEVCGGELAPVLEALKVVQEEGVHLEIANLVIPSLNDDPQDMKRMCIWIKDNLGEEIPLHFNRFFPAYKLKELPPTSIETLERARGIADEVGLRYVYIGNVPGHRYDNTFCPECGGLLIHRMGLSILANNIQGGRCEFCGQEIPGIW